MNRLLLQVLYFFARTDGQLARSTEGSQYTPPQKEELAQLQLDGLLPRLLGPDEVLISQLHRDSSRAQSNILQM